MTVPRNGVFYTLDARTGKEALPPRGIGGTAYPSLKQIDLSTLSSTSPAVAESDQAHGRSNARATGFGHGWFPMSYNAQTGLVYISAYEVKEDRRGGQGPALEADGLAARLGDSARGGSGQYRRLCSRRSRQARCVRPHQTTPRWVATLPVEINGGDLDHCRESRFPRRCEWRIRGLCRGYRKEAVVRQDGFRDAIGTRDVCHQWRAVRADAYRDGRWIPVVRASPSDMSTLETNADQRACWHSSSVATRRCR